MKRLFSAILALSLILSLSVPCFALETEDAKALLERYYIDEIPEEILALEQLDELLKALGDPYTSYLSPESYDTFSSSYNGDAFYGIGVGISPVFTEGFSITKVYDDSPAQRAGLREGDVIMAVDGHILSAGEDPSYYIRGENGTRTVLTVRQATGLTREINVTRARFQVPVVDYLRYDDALLIACGSFGERTASGIKQALDKYESRVAAVVLDLRSNPGGTTQAAMDTAGLFLGENRVVTLFRYANGRYSYYTTEADQQDETDKPLIILQNGVSASSSELLAAAVRDHRGGISIGQRSFGKGVAQVLLDESTHPQYFDGDALKVTMARFFSPAGATNHEVGVLPTLVISPINTETAALLLCTKAPRHPQGHLMLALGGHSFYIELETALAEENRSAFRELLEALPPAALLFVPDGEGWISTAPAQVAEELGLPFTPRTFTDMDDSAYPKAIGTLACYGLLGGYPDGSFRPQQTITRTEFCAMVTNALNLSQGGFFTFSDVEQENWFAGAVGAMAQKGFLSGYGDGTFRPEQTITFEEMTAVLANAAAWLCTAGYNHANTPLSAEADTLYSDFSPWARSAANTLNLMGALTDYDTPQAPCTREQAAAALYALMNSANLFWK